MKKITKTILILTLVAVVALTVGALSACNKKDNAKTITVCASDVPHAEILNGVVKGLLEAQGYKLEVRILDWQEQNGAVASGDYDANYFQHLPYLVSGDFATQLAFTCKVHYEPLGVYYGKATVGTQVANGRSFAICNDESNAVRALQLLETNGLFSRASEGANYPINNNGGLAFSGSSWTASNGARVDLIAENLLVASMRDYDFACLPCNTALTGNVSADSNHRAAVESDPAQVTGKANGLAVRKADYLNDATYKAKIDALTNALLSQEVANFIAEHYNNVILCNSNTQIDLRSAL